MEMFYQSAKWHAFFFQEQSYKEIRQLNTKDMERNLIYVKNVAKPFVRAQVFINIREFILKRNLTNERNVAKALIRAVISLDI